MNGLFDHMQEHHAERLAIMLESGVENATAHAADDLHRCEIQAVMRQCYPDGQKAASYFELVEKKRGKGAADRLRNDVRAVWMAKKAEERA